MSAPRLPFNPAVPYAMLVPIVMEAGRRLGYAIALHGSMVNDLDLVAVPWTDAAAAPEDLLEAVLGAIGWAAPEELDPARRVHGPTQKPHGRVAWTIPLGIGAAIDLSVTPRVLP